MILVWTLVQKFPLRRNEKAQEITGTSILKCLSILNSIKFGVTKQIL